MKPKVSPLAQNNSNGGSSSPSVQTPQTPISGSIPPPPPAPPMGSLAMGMPFQVFPTGPAVKNNQQLSAPKTNGNSRKSPQSFDPPPMGCRPEIKIPENPMAMLRSVPKPRPKSDFWIDEYVQEKSSDPAEEEERQQIASSPSIQQQQQYRQEYRPSPPAALAQREPSPVRYERTPTPPERRDFRNVRLENMRTASPVQVNRSSPVASPSPIPSSMSSPPIKTITIEPIQTSKQPAQTYQQPQPVYQPSQSYQQQPSLIYQQPQPTQQQQEQPSQGGRIILSTMPNKQHQAQQNVSRYLWFSCLMLLN